MAHTKLTERLIRQTLPGPEFTAERKQFRQMAEKSDIEGLRALTGDSGIISQAAATLIDELERVAKDRAKTLAQNEEITKAIQDGCPCCGRKIKRNLSLTGWWQCSQFGAVGFRVDSTQPACNWQAFYVAIN